MKKYIIISITIALLFTACAKNEPLFTTKVYSNIKDDAILNAAKKVLLLSDSRYKIESQSNNITAQRSIVKYKIYDADIEINTIKLSTVTDKKDVIAKLEIKQRKDFFKNEHLIQNPMVHKLFWDRVNYILGLNHTWTTCFEYNVKLNYDGILCDRIYNDNFTANKSDIIVSKIKQHNTKSNNNILKTINLEKVDDLVLPNQISNQKNIPIDLNITKDSNSTKFIDLRELDNIKLHNKNDSNDTIKTKVYKE